MKITLLTAAILTLVGIATTPAKATDNDAAVSNETSPTSPTNSAATSKTSADTETITTYVVHYGGAG